MSKTRKRSDFQEPVRREVVELSEDQAQAFRDGLDRAASAGVGRYRAGADALDALEQLVGARAELDREVGHQVGQARRCGVRWSEIGMALGVSQQAVSKKYGPKLSPAIRGDA
jgi:hypothetical protein